jgi:ribosomal protein S18 acetylase RimI-like enzyme
MNITYKLGNDLDPGAVNELYLSAGLKRPTDLPRLAAMYRASNLVISAWDGDRLVGVARSLTDFRFACYLSDLAVHADYQRQGIGKRLIAETEKYLGEESMLLLLAAPTAKDYYGHIGFDAVQNGWIKTRKR